jgi:SMODS-associated and fused to various effectors sensor domain
MKTPKPQGDTLFAPRQRGGVIGGLGYNFQDAYIITVLPKWLARPDFVSFMKEGFDDVDVVFTNSGTSSTWHYQLKDHEVSLAEFRKIVGDFAAAAGRPGVNATSFVLGCCGLASKVRALWAKIQEFRGARKTYSEAALASTKVQLLSDFKKLGLSDHADLLLDVIEIDYENPGLHDADARMLKERFRGLFMALPLYRGEAAAALDRLFEGLLVRVNKAVRTGISRDEVERLIGTELAAAVKGRAVVVHLHGWTRQAYDLVADEEIDWTEHFDHATLRVPAPEVWASELMPALHAVRARFDANLDRRFIWLRTRAPLSAGLAFGHAFAEAAGYSIRIQQPSPGAAEPIQHWETDAQADPKYQIGCDEVDGDPAGYELVVGIGVTDDPRPKVEHYLAQTNLKVRAAMYLRPSGGASATSVDATTVGAFASAAKREIRRACNSHQPRLIHLFYFGPLGLAVLLGPKLNGLADIQCYERSKTTGYTPSCRLPA